MWLVRYDLVRVLAFLYVGSRRHVQVLIRALHVQTNPPHRQTNLKPHCAPEKAYTATVLIFFGISECAPMSAERLYLVSASVVTNIRRPYGQEHPIGRTFLRWKLLRSSAERRYPRKPTSINSSRLPAVFHSFLRRRTAGFDHLQDIAPPSGERDMAYH